MSQSRKAAKPGAFRDLGWSWLLRELWASLAFLTSCLFKHCWAWSGFREVNTWQLQGRPRPSKALAGAVSLFPPEVKDGFEEENSRQKGNGSRPVSGHAWGHADLPLSSPPQQGQIVLRGAPSSFLTLCFSGSPQAPAAETCTLPSGALAGSL